MDSLKFVVNILTVAMVSLPLELLCLLCGPGFLNLNTIFIWGWITLCWGGRASLCILGYLAACLALPTRCQEHLPFSPLVITTSYVSKQCHISPKGQKSLWRTTGGGHAEGSRLSQHYCLGGSCLCWAGKTTTITTITTTKAIQTTKWKQTKWGAAIYWELTMCPILCTDYS